MKTYYLAKILSKLRLSSFNKCLIDKTSKVDYGCSLTKVEIGRYSYIGAEGVISNTSIGNFCSIGRSCTIGGGKHPLNMVSTSPVFLKGKNFLNKNFSNIQFDNFEKVTIKNDVWIGTGSYIKSGITIGNGSIIGAHSVVTKDVEDYDIVAGNPAKSIRKRFDEVTIKKLLKSDWWNFSDEKLEELGKYFSNTDEFLEKIIID